MVPPPSSLRPSSPGTSSQSGTSPQSGFPDGTNTGYRNAPDYPGSLHRCPTHITSNTTYDFCDFPGGVNVGSLSTPVVNVTFHGCDFHGVGDALVLVWGDNITFDYDTFAPGVSSPPTPYRDSYQYGIEADGGWYTAVQQMTVTHSDFWGFGDAIDTQGSTRAKPQVFRDNWIHDAAQDGGSYHTDGIGTLTPGTASDSYMVIDHNTIASVGNTQGIAIEQNSVDHVTVANNYLCGFGYTVDLGEKGTSTNLTFTRNVYATDMQPDWGAVYNPDSFTTAGLGNHWANNTYLVVPGTTWIAAGNNRLYWWPTDTPPNGNGGGSRGVFGHTTDYVNP